MKIKWMFVFSFKTLKRLNPVRLLLSHPKQCLLAPHRVPGIESEPQLRPAATLDPLTRCAGPGIEPASQPCRDIAGRFPCTTLRTAPCYTLWKEVYVQPQLRSRELCPTSLRVEYQRKLFEIHLHRRVVSSPPFLYLVDHLFISLWTQIAALYWGF